MSEEAVQVKLCPICSGTGIWSETIVNSPTTTTTTGHICYGCDGEKYVEVTNV